MKDDTPVSNSQEQFDALRKALDELVISFASIGIVAHNTGEQMANYILSGITPKRIDWDDLSLLHNYIFYGKRYQIGFVMLMITILVASWILR